MNVAQVVLIAWAAGACGSWPHCWLDPKLTPFVLSKLGPQATRGHVATVEWALATVWAFCWPFPVLYIAYRMARGR